MSLEGCESLGEAAVSRLLLSPSSDPLAANGEGRVWFKIVSVPFHHHQILFTQQLSPPNQQVLPPPSTQKWWLDFPPSPQFCQQVLPELQLHPSLENGEQLKL